VPTDPRLPGGGGYTVEGLYDLKPTSFGRPTKNFVTLSDNIGKQTQHWNGIDISYNIRPRAGLTLQGGVSSGKTSVDTCDIVSKLPEMSLGSGNSNATSFPVTATNMWTPEQFCAQESPFLTQFKTQAVYLIPKVDVQLSGNFSSVPGPLIYANYNATNAVVSPSLGRPLSGGAPNVAVSIVNPGTLYSERLNTLDLSFGKIFRPAGSSRLSARLDIYNVLNKDTPVLLNNSYGAWQRPTDILPARFAKITVTFDF
jgi:hypothetical protein